MTHYLVQPRDWIFVKDCGFLSFAKNMGKNIGENLSRNLSHELTQKLLDCTKQFCFSYQTFLYMSLKTDLALEFRFNS